MIRFGYFRLNGRLVVFDVTEEIISGHRYCVASLSEDPRVRFHAVRPTNAIEKLRQHLEQASQPSVTWLPTIGEHRAAG